MGNPSLFLCFHSLVFQRPMISLYLPQLKMYFLIPKRKKGSIAESPFQRETSAMRTPPLQVRDQMEAISCQSSLRVYRTSLQSIRGRLLTGMWLLLPERSHLESLYPAEMRAPPTCVSWPQNSRSSPRAMQLRHLHTQVRASWPSFTPNAGV